jgi:hypothetical protein
MSSELVDTRNLAWSYCPGCDPERDPLREILTVCWCDEHRPTCAGTEDARVSVDRLALSSAGEANAETNRAWCAWVHRRTQR